MMTFRLTTIALSQAEENISNRWRRATKSKKERLNTIPCPYSSSSTMMGSPGAGYERGGGHIGARDAQGTELEAG